MDKIIGNIKKFWCLEGIVAIIFSIFTINALLCGSILGAILMGIFSYWWLKRVLSKPTSYKRGKTDWYGNKNLDL